MNQIKIVIWDLDNTFWNGTLAENDNVEFIQNNISIVKKLTDRGIVNSIVSKNDFEKAKNKLKEAGVWDLFVFPQISWNPKGRAVKELLKNAGLRAENALFLDDNLSNLKEVEFYNQRIYTEMPDFLLTNFLNIDAFRGKDDSSHSRLQQYKILEQRVQEKKSYMSNEDFLRDSNIHICFGDDWENHADRVYELLQRSNQLNYTKNRSGKDEFDKLIGDSSIEKKYISVNDRFGDYGIAGFYAVKDNKLIHFFFSCRILGFGVENYVYRKLDCPKIGVIGDIAIKLDPEYGRKIDWIHEEKKTRNGKREKQNRLYGAGKKIPKKSDTLSVLMIAGCDLKQASTYIAGDYNLREEFSTVINGCENRTSDSCQLLDNIDLGIYEKEWLCTHLPFMSMDVTFSTEMFSGKYDVIVYSVIDDYIRGIYKRKGKNYFIGYGAYFEHEAAKRALSEKQNRFLEENFTYIGKETRNLFEKNLERIISLIPKKTILILINGIELDVSNWIGEDRVQRNIEMNKIVDKIVDRHNNVKLLDMRQIVISRNVLIKKDNRHYDRNTYYLMAKELVRLINESGQTQAAKTKGKIRILGERTYNKIKSYGGRINEKFCNSKNSEGGWEEKAAEIEQYGQRLDVSKKVVIVYGNCHTEAITDILLSCADLKRDYTIKRIKPIQTIMDKSYLNSEIFRTCDIFIHQSIWVKNRYGPEFASENIIKRLKSGCRVIAIPNVYHQPMCFFPQYLEKEELKWKGQTVFFRDSVIDDEYWMRKSVKELTAGYQSDDLFDKETIIIMFNKFIDKMRMREKDWDIKVSKFILENYKEHQLFYDPNHPTTYFLKYVANKIVEILLDEKESGKDYLEHMENVRLLDAYEMPVCNAVKKALDIKEGYNDVFRKNGRKVKYSKNMNLEEYISQYRMMRWTNGEFSKVVRANSFCMWLPVKAIDKLRSIKDGGKIIVL